jgi:hypothetical protein
VRRRFTVTPDGAWTRELEDGTVVPAAFEVTVSEVGVPSVTIGIEVESNEPRRCWFRVSRAAGEDEAPTKSPWPIEQLTREAIAAGAAFLAGERSINKGTLERVRTGGKRRRRTMTDQRLVQVADVYDEVRADPGVSTQLDRELECKTRLGYSLAETRRRIQEAKRRGFIATDPPYHLPLNATRIRVRVRPVDEVTGKTGGPVSFAAGPEGRAYDIAPDHAVEIDDREAMKQVARLSRWLEYEVLERSTP